MDRPLKWLEVPMNLVLYLALLAGAAMMLHIVADVIGRTFFSNPLAGTNEIVTYYYMVTAAYLPWMWITRNDSHIKVDLFVRMLPARPAFWLDIVVKLITIFYLGLFAWQSYLQAVRQTGRGEVQEAGGFFMPVWPTRWLLPIAGGLAALYLVFWVIHALGARRRGT